MSEDLQDEIEALNSIYGDSTLVSSDDADTYILTLPSSNFSLKIQFPVSYPSEPPSVVGTHSAGEHTKPGAAAEELSIFCDALGTVFTPGQVCLFDAIEEHVTLLAAHAAAHEAAEGSPRGEEVGQALPAADETDDPLRSPPPPWTLSEPIIEQRSTFVARCAPVRSPDEAKAFLAHLMASDRKVRGATHNITAWRIRGEAGAAYQDCDDDGETAAGGRLLHLMQLMELWDVMVVVTRWYGGLKLGPRRFALINQAARDALVRAGLVTEVKKKGSK